LNKQTKPEKSPTEQLQEQVVAFLEEFKAVDIKVIDVSGANPLTDRFIIASGTSSRHVRAMAERLVEAAKADGNPPIGVEGAREGEWALVDLNDVVVHLMQPQARAFYNLEKLWEATEEHRSGARSG
jgi:ribosome-associated protein